MTVIESFKARLAFCDGIPPSNAFSIATAGCRDAVVEHKVAGAPDGVPTPPSAPWQQSHILFTCSIVASIQVLVRHM